MPHHRPNTVSRSPPVSTLTRRTRGDESYWQPSFDKETNHPAKLVPADFTPQLSADALLNNVPVPVGHYYAPRPGSSGKTPDAQPGEDPEHHNVHGALGGHDRPTYPASFNELANPIKTLGQMWIDLYRSGLGKQMRPGYDYGPSNQLYHPDHNPYAKPIKKPGITYPSADVATPKWGPGPVVTSPKQQLLQETVVAPPERVGGYQPPPIALSRCQRSGECPLPPGAIVPPIIANAPSPTAGLTGQLAPVRPSWAPKINSTLTLSRFKPSAYQVDSFYLKPTKHPARAPPSPTCHCNHPTKVMTRGDKLGKMRKPDGYKKSGGKLNNTGQAMGREAMAAWLRANGRRKAPPRGSSSGIKPGNGGRTFSSPGVSISTTNSFVGANFRASGSGVRVRHKEYLRDCVSTSTSFTQTQLALNPGLPNTFPWLSTIARNYELYKFRSLTLEWSPACATSVAGELLLACDHDAADTSPSNKSETLQLGESQTTNVFNPQTLRWRCSGKRLFTRSGTLAANLDIKTYDEGNIVYAFNNVASGTVGSLSVVYDVEFFTPHFSQSENTISSSESITTTSAAVATPFSGTQATLGGLGATATAATLTLTGMTGVFLVAFSMTGTGRIDGPPTITPTGCTVTNLTSANFGNTAATAGVFVIQVTVTADSGAAVSLLTDFTASWTTVTSSVIRIARYQVV